MGSGLLALGQRAAIRCTALTPGHSPIDAERFVNAKAEAYWALRESLERGAVAGLTDEQMQAQLAGIRYRHTPGGRFTTFCRQPIGLPASK